MTGYTLYAVRYAIILAILVNLLGCDAFVRKFTRKTKKEELPQGELVLTPEEYKSPQMTKEALYRQYFLFWKSWHDELINALTQGASQKKQIYCIEEAIENLESLREFLNEQAQKKLDPHILGLKELKGGIGRDLYGNNLSSNAQKAERVKKGILKDLSYNKIKDYLI
jgi:hypothetical protein